MFGLLPNGSGDPFAVDARRIIAESIASNDTRLVTGVRLIVESILANETYVPTVSRLVLESISDNDAIGVNVRRFVAESITDAFGGLDPLVVDVRRLVMEVVCSPNEFADKNADVRRFILEAISDAYGQAVGLQLPDVGAASLAMVVAPTGAIPIALVEGLTYSVATDGIRFSGPGGTAFFAGAVSPNGSTVVMVGPRVWLGGVELTYTGTMPDVSFPILVSLGTSREPSLAGKVAELMTFNRPLSDAEVTYLHGYLACKWLSGGACNIHTLPPPP